MYNNLLCYYAIGPRSYSSNGHTRIGSNSFGHGTSSGSTMRLNPSRSSSSAHTMESNLAAHKTILSEYNMTSRK